MLLFSRKNLFYSDYKWTSYPQNDPHTSGKLDETSFNATEGNQVVFLINKLMTMWDYRFTSSGNKMEKLIREKLPDEVKTQHDVQIWLKSQL